MISRSNMIRESKSEPFVPVVAAHMSVCASERANSRDFFDGHSTLTAPGRPDRPAPLCVGGRTHALVLSNFITNISTFSKK